MRLLRSVVQQLISKQLIYKSMQSQQKDLVIHLIIQDLLYHRMIYGVQKLDVHIEFYPDIASAVLTMLGHDIESDDEITDVYNRFMGRVDGQEDLDVAGAELLAEECYLALVG